MRHVGFSLMLAACAAPGTGSPQLTFAQAMAEGNERPAPSSSALTVALARFSTILEGSRATVTSGAPMPKPHVSAWHELLSLVETGLVSAPALELVRARLVLQGELDSDKGTFGDIDAQLAERIVHTLRGLSSRLTEMTSRPHRATPASWLWPTAPVLVTSGWGDRIHPIHGAVRFHAGVDLAGEPGQEVRAVDAGVIVFAGWNGAHGKQVEVQHDAHLATRYSHLMTVLVDPGQHVRRGDVIALVGQTGQATGPHLHFEVRRDGDSLDPEHVMPRPVEKRSAGVVAR